MSSTLPLVIKRRTHLVDKGEDAEEGNGLDKSNDNHHISI